MEMDIQRVCYICSQPFTCSGNCADRDDLNAESYLARLSKVEVCSCLSCILDGSKNDSEQTKKLVSVINKNFCKRSHTDPSYR